MTDCWACEGAVQPVGDSQSAEAPFVKFNQPNDFLFVAVTVVLSATRLYSSVVGLVHSQFFCKGYTQHFKFSLNSCSLSTEFFGYLGFLFSI